MKHVKLFENWQEDENMKSGSTFEYTPKTNVNSVTPEEANSLIVRALNIQANGEGGVKPIMLVGAPGMGMNAVANKAAQEAEAESITLDLSTMDLQDFVGVPRLSTKEIPNVQPGEPGVMSGTMEDVTPSWFPTEGSGIIVLDSINRANSRVANAAIGFAQSGRLGRAQLPAGWLIVATAHGTEDTEMPIPSAMGDRFTVLHLG